MIALSWDSLLVYIFIPTELTRHMPRKKAVREKNLLSSDEDVVPELEEEIDVSKCPWHAPSVAHVSI